MTFATVQELLANHPALGGLSVSDTSHDGPFYVANRVSIVGGNKLQRIAAAKMVAKGNPGANVHHFIAAVSIELSFRYL